MEWLALGILGLLILGAVIGTVVAVIRLAIRIVRRRNHARSSAGPNRPASRPEATHSGTATPPEGGPIAQHGESPSQAESEPAPVRPRRFRWTAILGVAAVLGMIFVLFVQQSKQAEHYRAAVEGVNALQSAYPVLTLDEIERWKRIGARSRALSAARSDVYERLAIGEIREDASNVLGLTPSEIRERPEIGEAYRQSVIPAMESLYRLLAESDLPVGLDSPPFGDQLEWLREVDILGPDSGAYTLVISWSHATYIAACEGDMAAVQRWTDIPFEILRQLRKHPDVWSMMYWTMATDAIRLRVEGRLLSFGMQDELAMLPDPHDDQEVTARFGERLKGLREGLMSVYLLREASVFVDEFRGSAEWNREANKLLSEGATELWRWLSSTADGKALHAFVEDVRMQLPNLHTQKQLDELADKHEPDHALSFGVYKDITRTFSWTVGYHAEFHVRRAVHREGRRLLDAAIEIGHLPQSWTPTAIDPTTGEPIRTERETLEDGRTVWRLEAYLPDGPGNYFRVDVGMPQTE